LPDYSRTAWLALHRTRNPNLSSSEAMLDHSVALRRKLDFSADEG
jgi:hypothetical protein